MSTKKNWSLALELTQHAAGQHHVAEARTRFKQIASRYVRRSMRRQLDELLAEMQIDRLAEKREREEELRDLREWEAAQTDMDWYLDQQQGGGYEDDYYDDYYDWNGGYSAGHFEELERRWDSEPWNDEPSWVTPEREIAERQKDAWLSGLDPRKA